MNWTYWEMYCFSVRDSLKLLCSPKNLHESILHKIIFTVKKVIRKGNIRDTKLLKVIDELFSHHDDEELLGQFDEAASRTTLHRHGHDTAEYSVQPLKETRNVITIWRLQAHDRLTSSFLTPNRVP